jgi:hypothetical protein
MQVNVVSKTIKVRNVRIGLAPKTDLSVKTALRDETALPDKTNLSVKISPTHLRTDPQGLYQP